MEDISKILTNTEIDEEIGDQQTILAWFSAHHENKELPVAASLVSAFDLSGNGGQKEDTAQDRATRRDDEASLAMAQQSVDEGTPNESLGYQRLGFSAHEPEPYNPDVQALRGDSFPLLPRHRRDPPQISKNMELNSGNGHSEDEDKISYDFNP